MKCGRNCIRSVNQTLPPKSVPSTHFSSSKNQNVSLGRWRRAFPSAILKGIFWYFSSFLRLPVEFQEAGFIWGELAKWKDWPGSQVPCWTERTEQMLKHMPPKLPAGREWEEKRIWEWAGGGGGWRVKDGNRGERWALCLTLTGPHFGWYMAHQIGLKLLEDNWLVFFQINLND